MTRLCLALTLASAPLLAAISCSSDREEAHPYGDSRYGKTSLPLTVPDGAPYLDFDQNAPDPTAIALTFDDGPDVNGYTKSVLDTLKTKGVKATFFVNSKNYVDVASSTAAQDLLRRMIAEGHAVGNHTVDHKDLTLTSTDVNAELGGVDSMLHTYVPTFLATRLVRAPYGNPYFGPQDRLDYVAPIVAHYGVHVGWNIDSLDWKCDSDGMGSSCVTSNVLSDVDAGNSGIVLMHCVNPLTAQALPGLIDSLRNRGKRFVSVDSLVSAKYGDVSRHLFICSRNSDCVSGESCRSNGHCGTSTTGTDAGVDTGVVDTGVADSGIVDTGATDTATGDGGTTSATLTCSSFTVISGTIGGSLSTACSGTTPALAANDKKVLAYNASSTATKADGYATYVSPFPASAVTSATVTVAYRGDDKTEPLWYWYARNAITGAWDRIGDDSWAGNWTTTAHTFTLASPASYVDASGLVRIRFTTTSSTNDAELDQMIVRLERAATSSDAGASDTAVADTAVPDTAVADTAVPDTAVADTAVPDTAVADTAVPDTAVADTAVPDTAVADTSDAGTGDTAVVTETITCSTLTLVSGSLYGASSTACSGTTPALATANGTVVGWAGKSTSTKSSAYATYVSPAPAASVTAMSLLVTYDGDDKTEPAWYWYARNVTTGAWDLVGDNSWAGNWVSTSHTFALASPQRYVAADGKVQILFTTSTSTNDAELDRMVLQITH